jgi:hypothetical protein
VALGTSSRNEFTLGAFHVTKMAVFEVLQLKITTLHCMSFVYCAMKRKISTAEHRL